MKQFILALAAVTMMSISAMAQDTDENHQGKSKIDKTEMIQKRTEQTAKEYGLSEAQEKQLLALNTKYSDKMMPQRGRKGMGRPNGRPGNNSGMRQDSIQQRRLEMTEAQKQEMKAKRQEMKAVMDAYNKELQDIMTAEQFQKYQANTQKRMQRGKGQRPQEKSNSDNENSNENENDHND